MAALNNNGLRDLKGLTFGHLKVLFIVQGKIKGKNRWRCQCVCGKRLTIRHDYLIHTNSPKTHCGCKARVYEPTFIGIHRSEYHIWKMMLVRCFNPRHKTYLGYGAKGITCCPQWVDNFPQFIKDVGVRPSMQHSLDRKDPFGNYEPGNVKWSTKKEQARNKKKSLFLPHPHDPSKGNIPAAECAELLGCTYQEMRHKYIAEGRWPT